LNTSSFYREFGGERAFMDLQYEVGSLKADDSNHRLAGYHHPFKLAPWEYQRMLKVAQRRAIGEFEIDQRLIAYLFRNDSLVSYERVEDAINKMPSSISPDEDRLSLPVYSTPWQFATKMPNQVTWRRYTLLRLGLAAYKFEHEELPENLLQLKGYYRDGLPTTVDGMMFAWFKEGLEADLVTSDRFISKPDESQTYRKLADGKRPLLLPFSLRPNFGVPPIRDLGAGKQGIEVDDFRFGALPYRPRYGQQTEYRIRWNIFDDAKR
jgi:hypothetical protein